MAKPLQRGLEREKHLTRRGFYWGHCEKVKAPPAGRAAACPYARDGRPAAAFASLDELWPCGAGLLVFLQDTEPPGDFGIRLD